MPVTTMVFRGSLTRRSVTGGNRPKVKKVQPLIVIDRQSFLQKPDCLTQSFLQPGIAVVDLAVRCDGGCRRRDGIAYESPVAQPALANHKAGQHRCARDLRKQERAKRKRGGFGEKREVGTVTLID